MAQSSPAAALRSSTRTASRMGIASARQRALGYREVAVGLLVAHVLRELRMSRSSTSSNERRELASHMCEADRDAGVSCAP